MFIFNENSFYGFRAFTCKTKIENGIETWSKCEFMDIIFIYLFNVIYFNFILNSFLFYLIFGHNIIHKHFCHVIDWISFSGLFYPSDLHWINPMTFSVKLVWATGMHTDVLLYVSFRIPVIKPTAVISTTEEPAG